MLAVQSSPLPQQQQQQQHSGKQCATARASSSSTPTTTVAPAPTPSVGESLVTAAQQQLVAHFESLYNSPMMSDVTLLVGASYGAVRRVHAHRLVLAARSEVFRGMLDSPMQEARSRELHFPDCTPAAFESVVRFLYSSKIFVDDEHVVEVYNLAQYYDVALLRDYCLERMERAMSVGLVSQALTVAALYKEPALKRQCRAFIRQHAAKVLESDEFVTLPQPVLVKLLRRSDVLIAPETLVFSACLRWAEAQVDDDDAVPIVGDDDTVGDDGECASSSSSSSSRRERVAAALSPLARHIRFATMSADEYADVVAPHESLLDADVLDELRRYRETGERDGHRWRVFEPRSPDAASDAERDADAAARSSSGGMFDFLVNYPQFDNLKAIIKQNPKLVDPVVAELARSNPELGKFINDNRNEFMLLFQ